MMRILFHETSGITAIEADADGRVSGVSFGQDTPASAAAQQLWAGASVRNVVVGQPLEYQFAARGDVAFDWVSIGVPVEAIEQ
jgi:hypothetical protein